MRTIKLLSPEREARSGSTLVMCTFTEIVQEFIQDLQTRHLLPTLATRMLFADNYVAY